MTDNGNRQTATATAVRSDQSDKQLRSAMLRLLDALRPFIPRDPHVKLPDHNLGWVIQPDGSPERVILDAIQAHPELWVHALPETICIVSRQSLLRALGSHNGVFVEALAHEGANIVASHAARHLHEAEKREMARR